MTPAEYDFPDHIAGDTVSARRFTVTRTAGGVAAPENLTGVAIHCWFQRSDPIDVQLSVGTGITLVNAAGGVFDLGPFRAPAAPGVYRYDIQFAYPDGRVRTYVAGKLKILPDVSKP
jgi:hypothetical protein